MYLQVFKFRLKIIRHSLRPVLLAVHLFRDFVQLDLEQKVYHEVVSPKQICSNKACPQNAF